MEKLSINRGIKEFEVAEGVTVAFNPADIGFISRLFSEFEGLTEKDKEWREKLKAEKDPHKVVELFEEGGAMFANAIDNVLGEGVTAAFCGGVSVLAISEGLPIWALILLEIISKCDDNITAQMQAENPKLKKYIEKYGRK